MFHVIMRFYHHKILFQTDRCSPQPSFCCCLHMHIILSVITWALAPPPTEELYQLFGQAFYSSLVIKDRNIQHVAVLH